MNKNDSYNDLDYEEREIQKSLMRRARREKRNYKSDWFKHIEDYEELDEFYSNRA